MWNLFKKVGCIFFLAASCVVLVLYEMGYIPFERTVICLLANILYIFISKEK